MVVDRQGLFLTQRQQQRMVLVQASVDDTGMLHLQAPGMPDLRVAVTAGETLQVTVWRDTLQASTADPHADQWLSDFLGQRCRLVFLPPATIRPVDQDYAGPADQVSFADGFPFLLISQASLDDLNARMSKPITIERFRPNLVVTGCEPYEEDRWRSIRIGEVEFRLVKPCSRCVIPTIDPETGERDGVQPLAALSRYRKQGNKVFFGQNLIHDQQGMLRVGEEVEVIEWA